MALWPRARTFLLEQATRLPPPLDRGLMLVNRRPDRLYGRAYRAHRALLARSSAAYDNLPMLLASVNRAIRTIPYYAERHAGTTLRSREQFERTFGFTDKETILANPDQFIDRERDPSDHDVCSTGGTSGKPLTFLAPKNRYVVELATMHALWETTGFRHDVRAVVRNHHIEGRRYLINPLTREVIFDGFHLEDDHLSEIYRTIVQLGIRFVHCYPSTAYELASFIQRRGLDPSRITAFLSGSETVFEYQRALIQDQLGIRFYNWYGHSEKLVLAGYCAGSDHYHVEPTYGYFELIDERGEVVRTPGEVGEIVGTSFHNPVMPFIRYRTGDLAEYVGDHCTACGRNVVLLRDIRGRWRGARIYKADGSFVTTTALNLHDDINRVINGMQYVQDRKGELTVLVVRSAQFTDAHEAALYRYFKSRLGNETVVHLQYVERLRRNANGKLAFLISTLGDGTA